jgi:uncharacterized protein YbjT (DUF2867 family)
MIGIAGASGTNGREVIRQLMAAGQPLRALVRDPARATDLQGPGVELVAADLGRPETLAAALRGCDRAFLLTAVSADAERWSHNFVLAAKAVGVGHVVRFSGMGAALDAPSVIMRQHGQADAELVASGLAYTLLQPNSFYQNLLWSAASIKETGVFYLPLGDARQSLVDVADIGRVAGKALTEPGHEGKTHVITGPEALSYYDVAERLSAALGRTVRYVAVPTEAALQGMLASGIPEWNARAVAELYAAFTTGAYTAVTDTVERVTGRPPTPFAQWARDNAAAFR